MSDLLQDKWEARIKKKKKGTDMQRGARALLSEGNKLFAEAEKLWREGSALQSIGHKIEDEAEAQWENDIKKACGNIRFSFLVRKKKRICELENGLTFTEKL